MGEIANRAKKIYRQVRYDRYGKSLVRNINFNPLRRQKKVLICYIDYNDLTNNIEKSPQSTNIMEAFLIIKAFMELDFCIDVCDAKQIFSERDMPHHYYDCIFGFGRSYRFSRKYNPQAECIEYYTEAPFEYSLRKEKERMEYFNERHKCNYSLLERTGNFYEAGDEFECNYIICMGSVSLFDKEKEAKKGIDIYRIYPSGFYNSEYKLKLDNKKQNEFLVLASSGFIHKGYDLMLEIFRNHPEWELHFCGNALDVYCKEYKIKKPDNVINHGFVRIESNEFIDIINNCYYQLMFSCSESSSTAVLTGMRHGMIPVVMENLGFEEMNDVVVTLKDFHIDYLERQLEEAANRSNVYLDEFSKKVYAFSKDRFSLETFYDSFYKTLEKIMNL